MAYDLSNQTIIITGATTGLGKHTAKKFIDYGANVCIFARQVIDLEQTIEEFSLSDEKKNKVFTFAGNAACESDFVSCIESTIKHFGKVTGLINNAAIHGPIGSSESVSSEEWFNAIQNNLMSTFYGCQHILPYMQKNNYGKIINLSGSGEKPLPRFSAYSTSKAAVVKLTEVLAEENKHKKIFINSIAPGPMNTFFLDDVLNRDPETVGKEIYKKRMEQKESGGVDLNIPSELCAFLMSDKSEFFTGKLISAVWDDWQNFTPELANTLNNSEIYTMRRQIDTKERF